MAGKRSEKSLKSDDCESADKHRGSSNDPPVRFHDSSLEISQLANDQIEALSAFRPALSPRSVIAFYFLHLNSACFPRAESHCEKSGKKRWCSALRAGVDPSAFADVRAENYWSALNCADIDILLPALLRQLIIQKYRGQIAAQMSRFISSYRAPIKHLYWLDKNLSPSPLPCRMLIDSNWLEQNL